MGCRDFEIRLQRRLDERARLAGDPGLLEHARHCRRCAQRLRGLEVIEQLLAGESRPAAGRTALPPAWFGAAWAAAAAVMAVLLALWMAPDGRRPDERQTTVARLDSPAAAVPGARDLDGEAIPAPRERPAVPRPLAYPLADAATSSLVYSSPRHWIELPAVIANQVGSGSWLQVSDSLRPVTRTVQSALVRLRESLEQGASPEVAPQARHRRLWGIIARAC